MPQNITNIVIPVLILGIWVLALVGIIVRIIKNKHSPLKMVKATVIDKHIVENFSKYAGNGKHEKYAVVFSVEGKKLSFYVSQFSYGRYRVGAFGTLKYQGDKIIDFD